MREDGIPMTPDGRLSIAARIVEHALAAGMQLEEPYVDPLVMTVSADHRAGHLDLSTLRLIRQRFPQVRTISGVSNISFGLPKRRLLNRAFAAIPVSLGLDAYIVDVRDPDMMPMLLAARAVAGQDSRCRAYLKAYRAGRLGDILK